MPTKPTLDRFRQQFAAFASTLAGSPRQRADQIARDLDQLAADIAGSTLTINGIPYLTTAQVMALASQAISARINQPYTVSPSTWRTWVAHAKKFGLSRGVEHATGKRGAPTLCYPVEDIEKVFIPYIIGRFTTDGTRRRTRHKNK